MEYRNKRTKPDRVIKGSPGITAVFWNENNGYRMNEHCGVLPDYYIQIFLEELFLWYQEKINLKLYHEYKNIERYYEFTLK